MKKVRKANASSPPARRGQVDSEVVGYLSAAQLADIEQAYRNAEANYKALLEEVAFILQDKIAAADVRTHGIEKRLKSLSSVENKCRSKNIADIGMLVDIAGARAICLFRSDMSKVGEIIHANFDVQSVDDKISNDGPLGYMSIHYVCKMPERYTGPRYENTRNLQFEIQVRTLCMHAWAAVSHYLDYKGEWDVPEELKRALSALGGLFYVADSEFEQFYAARVASKSEAEKTAAWKEDQEINLDTMSSFLVQALPDRNHSDVPAISLLVQEIKRAKYRSMREVSSDVARGRAAFEAYENKHPPSTTRRYADVGVVRATLRIVNKNMRELARKEALRFGPIEASSPSNYDAFEALMRSE
jgi:ppGpp synthetase/RelA/SpoT-type nucleotidyltranferase